ncbi:DUF1990 family protein [Pseudolysinimonas sp.]|uniref:DUF1990 family protein n=1 Tax=Pseudolysinimonas sp. TaxID=2680009 RepID=UPI003F7E9059
MAATPLWQVPVTYGAIGATRAEDLLTYPPRGYRPLERRVRIGHGDARWEFAWTETLSWGIQRRVGLRVELLPAPAAATAATYTPVAFDAAGEPVQPAVVGEPGETVYAPGGAPLLRPGDTARLRMPFWPRAIPARVVYVVDEPGRRGFAYGTLPGHPERGEEAFIVERLADDSVWLVIRAFSRPAGLLVWLGAPVARLLQAIYTARYERALAGPLPGADPAD